MLTFTATDQHANEAIQSFQALGYRVFIVGYFSRHGKLHKRVTMVRVESEQTKEYKLTRIG